MLRNHWKFDIIFYKVIATNSECYVKGFSHAKHVTAIINVIARFSNLTMHFKLQLLQSYGKTACHNRNTTYISVRFKGWLTQTLNSVILHVVPNK